MAERLSTVEEVAAELRVARKTVWNLLSKYRGRFDEPQYQRLGAHGWVRRMLSRKDIEILRGILCRPLVKEKMLPR